MIIPRSLAGCALTALVLVAALATGVPRNARAGTAIDVRTTLPDWVAPAASVRVAGRTAANAAVELRVGPLLRRTTSGPWGGFRFRLRAPLRKGRYPVSLAARDTRAELGRLRVRPLRLAAVGDVTFGNGVRTAIAAHGARYPWLSVAPVLRSADLAVANLEGAVSTRGAPWPGKQYTFRGPPSALRTAGSFAGLDAVSVANNHSLDYGRLAFRDTLRHARRSGIAPFGGGADADHGHHPPRSRARPEQRLASRLRSTKPRRATRSSSRAEGRGGRGGRARSARAAEAVVIELVTVLPWALLLIAMPFGAAFHHE